MANRTVTVTVASGTLYVVGGTGNSFYIDGTRPGDFTVDWVEDGTIRFEQSDSSNDGHPLIFSTSNSSTLGTMQAGIISSGVTYYLDGSSNQSDYTNPTTFNAATTRYIEIAPASQTDFYFACWVHGIGMGGIMDITQSTWGALSWSDNAWGTSNNIINATAQVLTVSTGTVEAFNLAGWGRRGWGDYEWGDSGLTVSIAVTGLTTLATSTGTVSITAELNSGWGRAGYGEDGWGIQGDVLLTGQSLSFLQGTLTVTTDVTQGWGRQAWGAGAWGMPGVVTVLTGFGLATTLGTETVTGDALVIPTGISLTTSLGNESVITDVVVSVTGQSIATSTGTLSMAFGVPVTGQVLTTNIGEGWGVSTWDSGVWGGVVEVLISPIIIPTGQVIATALGTETVTGDAIITLSGNSITTALGTETISISIIASPTGQALASSLGSATVTTEVNVGWGRQTWGYGQWGDAGIAVAITGQAMSLVLGNESTTIDVAVTATGFSLTTSMGTAVAGASAEAPITGQVMTAYTGTVYPLLWTEIDPDVSMVWTEIAA